MKARLSARARKSFADVLRRKGRSAALVLAILIPIAGLTAASVAGDSLSSAYAFTVSRSGNRQDVAVTIDRTTPSLVGELAGLPNVARVQAATDLDTQWHVAAAPGHVDFRIVGYPDPHEVPLTPFELVDGRQPGVGEIVMEYGDRGLEQIAVGDAVLVDTATGTASLHVVGIARTPGIDPAVSGQGIGYMSAAGLDRLPAFELAPGPVQRQPFRSEQISLELHDPSSYRATVELLGPVFQAAHVTVLAVFPPSHDAPVSQLGGILSLVRILLVVALVLCSVLVASAVTALIAGQTTVIGTMKALGASRATIGRGYGTTVLLHGAVATPLGIALGITLGGMVATAMAASIPLSPGPLVISPATLLVALSVGLILPLLAALLPIWLGTRVAAHEALSGWGVASVERAGPPSGRESTPALLSRVPQTVWVGLRGLFRSRWRTAISVLTIAVAATSFLAVQSLASSVNRSIGTVWGAFSADVEVYVGGSTSYRDIASLLEQVPNVGRIERVGWFGSQTAWGKVGVWGIEPRSGIHVAHVTSGRWFTADDRDVCLVSDDLVGRAGLQLGSTITVQGPVGTRSVRCTVIGTVDEPVDDLSQVGTVDMPVDTLYQLEGAPASGAGDYTNRVLVQAVDRSPAAVDRLTRAIDARGRQAGREGSIAEVFAFHDEVVRHQRNFLPVYAMLLVAVLVVSAVGILGLVDGLTASVLERQRDIGLLRALGATGGRVAVVFWVKGVAESLVAWVVAAAIGLPLAYLFVQFFRGHVMPTDLHFDPISLAAMVAVTLGLATVASIVPASRAAALRPAQLLRNE